MGEVNAVVNGNTINSVITGNGYTFNIGYKMLDIGNNTVTISAFDAAGNETFEDVIVEKIDNVSPVIGGTVSVYNYHYPVNVPGGKIYPPPPPTFQAYIQTTIDNIIDNNNILDVVVNSGSALTLNLYNNITEQYENLYPIMMIKGSDNSYYIQTYIPFIYPLTGNIQFTVTVTDLSGNTSTRDFNINF